MTTANTTMMNAELCKDIVDDVIQSLSEIEEKYGLKISHKGGIFSKSNFTVKLQFSVVTDDGLVISKEIEDWNLKAQSEFNIPKDALNKIIEIEIKGKTKQYEIIGLIPRSYKYPVLLKEVASNKKIKVAANSVIASINSTGYIESGDIDTEEELENVIVDNHSEHENLEGILDDLEEYDSEFGDSGEESND